VVSSQKMLGRRKRLLKLGKEQMEETIKSRGLGGGSFRLGQRGKKQQIN